MAIDLEKLHIVHYPHPVLRTAAKPVERITDEVRSVAQRMLALMRDTGNGVGLAAPQVGLSWRMFVTNTTGEPEDDAVYINPRLLEPGRRMDDATEGCLSLPGITAEIRRPVTVTIEALNLAGEPIHRTAAGFEARVWQHEVDHLDGVLILDKMTPMDRIANQKLLRDLEQRPSAR